MNEKNMFSAILEFVESSLRWELFYNQLMQGNFRVYPTTRMENSISDKEQELFKLYMEDNGFKVEFIKVKDIRTKDDVLTFKYNIGEKHRFFKNL